MTEKGAIEEAGFNGYDYVPVHGSAKRCGVKWAPWMGDWFVSWSPRNYNEHSEGTWDHWVDLALMILKDPMTRIVRPDASAAVVDLEPVGFYSESARMLTDEELVERMKGTEGS